MSDSPRLGGKSALLVFILVLAAYVVESQLTQVSSVPEIRLDVHGLTLRQYVQATLKYRQPYFLMYVPQSPLNINSRTSNLTATWYIRPF